MSTLASVILRDITANRPAASIAGRLFFDTTLVKMQRDNGSSWDDVADAGSGAIPATIIDAKGDLIVGTAADTAARKAAGTNGYMLVADSAQSDGLLWTPRFVGCRAYNNAAQTVTAATETTVLFNAEEYDTDAIHDISTNTGRFTVPTGKGGKWQFTFHWSVIGTHGVLYAYLRKNGTTAVIGSEIDEATGTTDFSTVVTVTQDLAAADYIEARGYRTTGTTFGNNANATMCSMEAQFLG